MNSCGTVVDSYTSADGTLDVSSKYKQLMQDSLSEESLYIRAKETFSVIFEDLQISEKEKAEIVSQHVATMTTSLSAAAMQTALSWEKEERDGAYALAKEKAATELLIAQATKAEEEICLVQAQVKLQCANITATVSGTIRENGAPSAYEADGCTPTGLNNEGLKYAQTKQVEAAMYQTFADAYRKSGVVTLGVDTDDGELKGLSGDIGSITSGFTRQQTLTSERQRIGFEDSKRTHAANSAASMIGQLLSSETLSSNNEQDVDRWRDSVDFLNTSHSTTNQP